MQPAKLLFSSNEAHVWDLGLETTASYYIQQNRIFSTQIEISHYYYYYYRYYYYYFLIYWNILLLIR